MKDREYLHALHGYPCAVGTGLHSYQGCEGPVEAHHHTGGRGRGQKSDDSRAFPLCRKHHTEFHAASGYFKTWTKAERRAWQDAQVERFKPPDDVF